jgi:2-hydroxy-3-keto-5-methylthiopentenyl-1-phosphate phosphatase
MGLRLFVDFDGTVTRHDVGNAFFAHFGGEPATNAVLAYREGGMTAQECFRTEARAMGDVDLGDLLDFIDRQEFDPTFAPFVAWSRSRGLPVTVLSDGLDLYVDRILERAGCADVARSTNHAEVTPGADGVNRLMLAFPSADAVCTRCGCCKRNLMVTASGDEDVICYVGDGFSDFCPVQYADIVFAKSQLQTYCQTMNISYYPYASFDEVRARLETLLGAPRLRHRRAASVMRRRAFREES